MPRGDDARLAVVPAIIDPVEGGAAKDLRRIGEIKAAFFKRAVALVRIEGNLHPAICVPPEMSPVKLPRQAVDGDGGEFAEGVADPQVALRSPGRPKRA